MKIRTAAALAALLLSSCGGCGGDVVPSVALPPPFVPVPPALEAAPPPSAKLADHPALSRVPSLAEGWFADAARRTVHVQLDKPLYRPGEAVWVKSWSLSQQGLTGAVARRPLDYRLLGPRGEEVATRRVQETVGTATNDFVLDGNARGGTWTLEVASEGAVLGRRTFVVSSYQAPRFRKELEFLEKAYGPGDTVSASFSISASGAGPLIDQRVRGIVTVDGEELPPIEGTTDAHGELTVSFDLPAELSAGRGLLTLLVDDGGDVESIARPIPITLSDLQLGFFPEGGDLVAGLPSRVYFEGRDRYGEPADVAGVVVDEEGREVAPFESLHDGFGRFEFTPEAGRRYRARLSRPAGLESAPFPLPAAKPAGCVLRTFDDPLGERSALSVAVRCTDPRPVVVVGGQRGEFLGFAAVQAGPDVPGVVHLDPSDPGLSRARGLARVTVLDEDLVPFAERLFFRNWRRGLQIAVSPDRAVHSPRDSVTLTVSTKDQDGQPVAAEVAVSVVDDAVLKLADDRQGTLLSAVLLEGELPGEIDKAGFYFDPEEDDAAAMLELLVGARGWRRFAPPPVTGHFEALPEPTGAREDEALRLPAAEAVAREPAPADVAAAPPSPEGSSEQVSSRSILALIGSSADLPALADRLGDDGGVSSGLGARGGFVGDGTGLGDVGDVIVGGGFDPLADPWKKEETVKVRVQASRPTVVSGDDGDLADIHRSLRRYQGRFKACYERELKRDPDVGGEVGFRITVAADGRVATALVDQNATGNVELGRCIEQNLKRMRFAPPPQEPITVSSSLVFASEGSRRPVAVTRPPPRRPSRPTYAPVREFPKPRQRAGYSGPRTDFRDTVFWAPSVRTDAAGSATVTFPLSDAIATFRVTAEGASEGDIGHSEGEIATQLPFSMSVKLPAEVSAGDRLELPVSLSNREPAPVAVSVACALGPLLIEGDRPPGADVPADGKARLFVPITVGDGSASTSIAVTADAAGLVDAETRTLRIVPRGFPRATHRSGQVATSAAHTVTLDPELQSVVGTLTLFPDPLSALEKGMEAMLNEPHGCFEQVSSANYPNVLALRYLQGRGRARPAFVRQARGKLERAYGLLAGYEVPGGGFDWYGRAPAHEELTAYGLLQFADMKRVHAGIDGALLGRAAAWLRSRSDGRGGFFKSERAWTFRDADDELRTAYIVNAIARAGQPAEPQGLAHSASLARRSDDPYLLALAASTLLASPGKAEAGRAAVGRLVGMQGADGAWLGRRSVTRSGEYGRRVESTALAVLALLEVGGNEAAVDRGVAWLQSNRWGDRWGATQSTILALRALVADAEAHPPPTEPSVVTVSVNGAQLGQVLLDPLSSEAVVVRGLEAQLRSGENRIELVRTGPGKLAYSLSVRSRSRQPADHPQAPLSITTALDAAQVPLGEPVALTAKVENTTDDDVANPLIRLGLPASLAAQPWQLQKMKDEGEIAAFETMGREVVLYLDGLGKRDSRTFTLDLLAEIPGRTTGPASTAYPYYSDDERRWAPELSIEVLGGGQGPTAPPADPMKVTPGAK